MKVMLIVFFNWKDIVHYEFVPRGKTVNKEFYLNNNNTWMLHNDNAPAHASLIFREFLTKHETTADPQPSYYPDLAPVDFFLIPKLKSSLKGCQFRMVEETEEILIWDLCAIPQNTFQNWEKCWEWCIKSGEEYFGGDKR